MIDIKDKKDCVGCNTCVQRCPKQCISMTEDEQGFLYPKVDPGLCINCGLCEIVCPVINQAGPRQPLETYAAKNPDDEIRLSSSSGGIFYALAKTIIEEGGVVFGAKFDENWEVVHDYAETPEGVRAFQGSKYVQSRIGESFIKAEGFLKSGRKVMFTGTPCQIAGLKHFLHKDYGNNLLTVDVVCHGVPSPLVWRDYLRHITRPAGESAGKNTDFQSTLKDIMIRDISRISFRDKRISWKKYGFSVHTVARQGDRNSDFQSTKSQHEEHELLFETLDKNLFMQGFLKDLYLRPSCYSCPVKELKSGSDITLADFWGIENVDSGVYDNNGISLILINSPAGKSLLGYFNDWLIPESYKSAVRYNLAIVSCSAKPRFYQTFWEKFNEIGIEAISIIVKEMSPTLLSRTINFIKRKLS